MKDIFRKLNLGTLIIATLTFVIGWQLGHKDVLLKWQNYKPTITVENKIPPANINVDFNLFWETWDLVSREYLNKKNIDPNKLFYGAIQGMVASLGDPYTVFLPPEQQKFTKEELNGSFDGVGMELGFNEQSSSASQNKDNRLVVVAPLSGTPADKAGIKAGDFIVKINGKNTAGMTLPEAVNIIRGPKGTEVKLTLFHDGDQDTKDVSLVRDTIVVKSVEVSFRKTSSGKNIAVIKLSRFGDRTTNDWISGIAEILSKNSDGVVLDVRNNPGGYLEGATFIASEFLDGGIVVIQENSSGERSPYEVNRVGKMLNIPLVVLINKGSASASEIVSGALQDRKRAKLVGEQSFGKGTVQEAQELSNGTGLHITVAKWLTPNGRWINDTSGLAPDIEVKADPKSSDDTKDAQLNKALELLN